MSFIEWSGPPPSLTELGATHLVGVGGAGMSGLARLLAAQAIPTSGCDAKESTALAALRAIGVSTSVGHSAAHVSGCDTLVVSSAIREDNPDLQAARQAGTRVLPRAVALASAMGSKTRLAVAGTHGKTTTTSMLTVALQACGRDPSYAIGGDLNEPGSNAHHGTGDIFVVEADESDRSFLVLRPDIAVITNVEADHLDNYGSADAVIAAFIEFVTGLPAGSGTVIANVDHPAARALLEVASGAGLTTVGFGLGEDGDVRAERIDLQPGGSEFTIVHNGRRLGPVRLAMPGRHNVANATAALAAGLTLRLPFADMTRGLAGFAGPRRRFEPRGVAAGVRVYDDYAHHPSEVAAALDAARVVAGGGRVFAVFQPHLFSRTAAFATEFATALAAADHVVVMDVYAAREDPIPGVTGALIATAIDLPPDRVHFEPSWSAVAPLVAELASPGDLVLTIGAGDVTMQAPVLLRALAERGR